MREALTGRNIVVVEDDPYGELRFEGESLPYIGGTALPHGVIMGSFSKTVTARLPAWATSSPRTTRC